MPLRSLPFFLTLLVTCVLTGLVSSEIGAEPIASTGTWGHSRIVEHGGHCVFDVDGKPFFMYGAAFFYERLPRDRWSSSMSELKEMGINTLDLYVPWNWHELSDGDWDFDGRTSPRRDLDEVFKLATAYDFKIVLRPGPVVRNEWRNGGYPAWLLSRPEYGMPLHDLLEGRYPPTATLQNQHSDDAAAEWMRNATHMLYAKRWVQRVLAQSAPFADRIVAIALDDDQGAYIDNQTYPAPHFQAYLRWLRGVVHEITGPNELTFINTYQMKVPASSPVWAMGNWYQSDTYSIGTHDESQLAFSFAQLATRLHQPLFASEFQAGWLQGPGEAYPRDADASNTELAMTTMIGTGVRGLVNFPAQDTLDPTGWEAPFANFAYAWNAALHLDGTHAARYTPTAQFGDFVRMFGPELAASFPRYDASIIYPGTSVNPASALKTTFSTIASATIDAQQACRAAGFACNVVDVASIVDATARTGKVFLLPAFDVPTLRQIGPRFGAEIAALSGSRDSTLKRIVSADDVRAAMRTRRTVVENGGGTVFSEATTNDLAGFLSVTNYAQLDRTYEHVAVNLSNGRRIVLPRFVVRAHSAFISPVDANLARLFPSATQRDRFGFARDLRLTFTDCMFAGLDGSRRYADPTLVVRNVSGQSKTCTVNLSRQNHSGSARIDEGAGQTLIDLSDFHVSRSLQSVARGRTPAVQPETALNIRPGLRLVPVSGQPNRVPSAVPQIFATDPYREGQDSIIFRSGQTELVISPNAGARVFYAEGDPTFGNWFTTVGGLRDDVSVEPPLSATDRIAKYTHDFPAGTFNRSYRFETDDSSATFSYTFPDALPNGATIEKTIRRPAGLAGFDLYERMRFSDLPPESVQRGVSVSSFALDPRKLDEASLFAPMQLPIVPGTTRTVDSGHAFAIKRGAQCLVVAWHAGDIEATALQERSDSIIARLTFARDRAARVIFRPIACDGARNPLTMVDAEAQLPAQVTSTPTRTP